MNKLTLLFGAATVALAIVCGLQHQKIAKQGAENATIQQALNEKTSEVESLQSAQQRAEQQRDSLVKMTEDMAGQLKIQQQAASNTTPALETAISSTPTNIPGQGGLGKMLAKLMEDPKTKQFIRDQQKLMMDRLYSPLLKKLGLSPEEEDQLKNLLSDRAISSAEKATSMFGGATNRTETLAAMAAEQKNFDEQAKALLGDSRYSQYKEYEQTLGERQQLSMFNQQFASGETALTDAQTEQLLTLMREEKATMAVSLGQNTTGLGQDQANLQAMLSEEQSDKWVQSQESMNQRVFERARGLLSASQLEAFGKFQANQLEMTRLGVNMARKLLAPDKADGSTSGQ